MNYDVRRAYQGIESPDNFSSRQALEKYRKSCLIKTETELNFFSCFLTGKENILEIGSGNGRLLLALKKNSLINEGSGIDVSETRTAFANVWAEDSGFQNQLVFINQDILNFSPNNKFQVITCITGTFGYFEGLEEKGSEKVMEIIKAATEPGAKLIIELYLYPEEIKKGMVREWKELPPDDPFRFYLYEKKWDEKNRLLYNRKIFIGRDGNIDEGRNDCQRIYTIEEITALLSEYGFETEKTYGDWQGRTYNPGDETLIIQAVKK